MHHAACVQVLLDEFPGLKIASSRNMCIYSVDSSCQTALHGAAALSLSVWEDIYFPIAFQQRKQSIFWILIR
jgi:hypothetical protein